MLYVICLSNNDLCHLLYILYTNDRTSRFLALFSIRCWLLFDAANFFKSLHVILEFAILSLELGSHLLFKFQLFSIISKFLLESLDLRLCKRLLLEQVRNLLSLIPNLSLVCCNLSIQIGDLSVEHLLQVFEFLLVHLQLYLKFLHRLTQLVLLILVLFPDSAYQSFILSAQRCFVILMLLL